jgi:uncharacterized protein YndB with AHSA1/START domain
MDVDTLSVLLDSGNLHWFEPRPEPDDWNVVAGIKVQAPPEVVWEVITDYDLLCRIMPDTYVECRNIERGDNRSRNYFKFQVSMVMFNYNLETVEMVEEYPPDRLIMSTIAGRPERVVEILLTPVENNAHTLILSRCYTNFSSAGVAVRLALEALPAAGPQNAIAAANYSNRAYKNEAERRAGITAPQKLKPMAIKNLDIPTLRMLDQNNGGLIRETPQGKIIGVLAYTFIDAPPRTVWEVMTDFDNYSEIFSAECRVESRNGNRVTVNQSTPSFMVLGMKVGYQLHTRYTLEPPDHLSYVAIDGANKGSHGDFRIMPLDGGEKSILFGAGGMNMEKDDRLFARIAKSGAFPLENMINMTIVQSNLARIRLEAQRRESGGKK